MDNRACTATGVAMLLAMCGCTSQRPEGPQFQRKVTPSELGRIEAGIGERQRMHTVGRRTGTKPVIGRPDLARLMTQHAQMMRNGGNPTSTTGSTKQ